MIQSMSSTILPLSIARLQKESIHGGTLQIARQENCLPAPLSRRPSSEARPPDASKVNAEDPFHLPAAAGLLSLVWRPRSRPRPIKLQTPRYRNALRHRCVRSFSFPTRQRGSEVGSRAAGRPLPTATGKNTPGLRDTDAAAVRVCLFPPASCELISEGK